MIAAISHGVLWLFALGLLAVTWVLIGQISELRAQLRTAIPSAEIVPLGARIPEFAARDVRTQVEVDGDVLRGRKSVLCLLSSGCKSCIELAEELAQQDLSECPGLVIHFEGEGYEQMAAAFPARIPVIRGVHEPLTKLFRVSGLPVTIIISEHGRILGYRTPRTAQEVLQDLSPATLAAAPRRQVA